MITDHISHAQNYFGLGERIKRALQYLIETDFSQVETGKYILDGEKVFALVQEYFTQPEENCNLEAHKEYIDIQFMVEGEECIGYELHKSQEIAVPYKASDDCWLFNGDPDLIRYTKGMFVILFPQDLHMPKVISGSSIPVKKVVIKVKVVK